MLSVPTFITSAFRTVFRFGKRENDENEVFENQENFKGSKENVNIGSDNEAKVYKRRKLEIVKEENDDNKVVENYKSIIKRNESANKRSKVEIEADESEKESQVKEENDETNVFENDENNVFRNKEINVFENEENNFFENDENNAFENDENNVFGNDENNAFENDENNVFENDENNVFENDENNVVENDENTRKSNETAKKESKNVLEVDETGHTGREYCEVGGTNSNNDKDQLSGSNAREEQECLPDEISAINNFFYCNMCDRMINNRLYIYEHVNGSLHKKKQRTKTANTSP